jgi:hypothetical protein
MRDSLVKRLVTPTRSMRKDLERDRVVHSCMLRQEINEYLGASELHNKVFV